MTTAQVQQHGAFLRRREIAQMDFKEKAIQLGFGQGKGAFILNRVLRRQHEKRAGQHTGHAIDRHLALAHTFKQSRLCSRRRAVDFVGQQNIRKGWARDKLKMVRLLIKDTDPGHITG